MIIGSVIGKFLQRENPFPSIINFTMQDEAGRDTYQNYARTTAQYSEQLYNVLFHTEIY